MASDERPCVECRADRSIWSYDEDFALLEASKNGHVDCVKACLAAGADVNTKYCWDNDYNSRKGNPLYWAVKHNNDDCAECLIKAGAKICDGVLSEAAGRGSERCVNLISEAGGPTWDREPYINKMLCYAVRYHPPRSKIVDLLINTGANVNSPWGQRALFDAVRYKNIQCTDQLLKAGADVNKMDGRGETALYDAVREHSVQCTDLLLKAGAGVNIQNKYYAACWNSVECMDLLMKAGADVNIRDKDGETALFIAVPRRSVHYTDLLLKAGADVNIRDKNGRTALFCGKYLVQQIVPPLNTIKMMFREEVKVNVKDNQGHGQLTGFLEYLWYQWNAEK